MKLAFSGPRVSGHNEELDTSGGTGTAIVVQAAGKTFLSMAQKVMLIP